MPEERDTPSANENAVYILFLIDIYLFIYGCVSFNLYILPSQFCFKGVH